MFELPRHHTPWLTAPVAAMVICAKWSLPDMAVAQRRMIVPPAAPGLSWLETMDQSPLTSTQLAPRSVESARLKLSLKLVTTGHLPDQAATGTLRTRLPEVSVNVSPEVTAFAVMVPDPPKEPAVDARSEERRVG